MKTADKVYIGCVGLALVAVAPLGILWSIAKFVFVFKVIGWM